MRLVFGVFNVIFLVTFVVRVAVQSIVLLSNNILNGILADY